MNLTEEPEIMHWPETYYVFIETIGPFKNTAPKAWQELNLLERRVSEQNQIVGAMALYKTGPDVYRAGYMLAAAPTALPDGLRYEKFAGGKYSRLVYTGPYSGLPEVSGRAWQIAKEKKIPLRDDFAIEHYVNDPKTTPQEETITEILFPTA